MVYSWNTDSYIYIGICGAQDLTVIIALVVNWCKTQTDAQDLDELEPLIRQEPEAQPFQLPTIPFQPPEQPIGF
ncbi:hypothetical protein L596_009875 [Steinernema carpocapsae]|nr:hypothetical protein L596_009875 [Steinernema carpocapsae]